MIIDFKYPVQALDNYFKVLIIRHKDNVEVYVNVICLLLLLLLLLVWENITSINGHERQKYRFVDRIFNTDWSGGFF